MHRCGGAGRAPGPAPRRPSHSARPPAAAHRHLGDGAPSLSGGDWPAIGRRLGGCGARLGRASDAASARRGGTRAAAGMPACRARRRSGVAFVAAAEAPAASTRQTSRSPSEAAAGLRETACFAGRAGSGKAPPAGPVRSGGRAWARSRRSPHPSRLAPAPAPSKSKVTTICKTIHFT